jgi:biotin carboxyl carrier protein
VRAGDFDTGLLERILAEPPPAPPEDLVPAAALAAAGTARPAGPFRLRLQDHGELRVADGAVRAGEHDWRADVRPARAGACAWRSTASRAPTPSRATATRSGSPATGTTSSCASPRTARGAAHGADSLEAPMPGTVLLVHAENGDEVEEGQVLS